MSLEECKLIFEKNGYDFRYATSAYTFVGEKEMYQHHFQTRRLDGMNTCRQIAIGKAETEYGDLLHRLLNDTEQLDPNFKRVFKEDTVTKLLKEIDALCE